MALAAADADTVEEADTGGDALTPSEANLESGIYRLQNVKKNNKRFECEKFAKSRK